MNCGKKVSGFSVCEFCSIVCSRKNDWDRHIQTDKHKKNTKLEDSAQFSQSEFRCDKCDYVCSKHSLWKKHCNTNKHQRNLLDTKFPNTAQNYTCAKCSKVYDKYSSYWAHAKKCSAVCEVSKLEQEEPADRDLHNIINKLLTDNQELRNFIIAQASDTKELINKVVSINTQPATVIHGNVNNNQRFNINVFLNERCKDAINFTDFVNNIEVTREDLQNTGQLGFVNGISKIILDNLKQLSVTERPIHCTDIKRETLYIKDEDKWNKELDDKKMRSVIQEVSRKSVRSLLNWKEVNPDYKDGDSDFSIQCLSMQRNSVAGDDRDVYFPKVAKIVAREVMVEKSKIDE